MEVEDHRQAPVTLPTRKTPGTHFIGGWVGMENLAHTGIRSMGRLAHAESLPRLRYPDPIGIHKSE
jgi:hypothetical protein